MKVGGSIGGRAAGCKFRRKSGVVQAALLEGITSDENRGCSQGVRWKARQPVQAGGWRASRVKGDADGVSWLFAMSLARGRNSG